MIPILLGRLGQIAILFISVKVATTFLSPSAYGQVSLFVALLAGFNLILVNPVGMFVNRRLHAWDREKKIASCFLLYGLYLLCACLFAIGFCFIVSYYGNSLIKGVSLYWVVVIVCTSIFFNTANQTFIPSLNLLGYRNLFVILTVVTLLCSLVASLFFIFFFSPRAEYWQFGQVVGQTIIGILGGIIFFKLIGGGKTPSNLLQINIRQIKSILAFILPVAVSVGLMWVQTQSYRFLVAEKIGLNELGLFFAGYSVSAAIISSFETVVTNYFLPTFYHKVSVSKQYEDIWTEYAKAIFPALLLTAAFIIIFANEITRILLARKFHYAVHYVMWGAIAEAGRVTVSTYGYLAYAKMKTIKLIGPNFIGAIFLLVSLFIFTPIFKANGVGLALVLSSLAVILVMHISLVNEKKAVASWGRLPLSFLFSIMLGAAVLIIKKLFHVHTNLISDLIFVGSFGVVYLICMYNLLYNLVEL